MAVCTWRCGISEVGVVGVVSRIELCLASWAGLEISVVCSEAEATEQHFPLNCANLATSNTTPKPATPKVTNAGPRRVAFQHCDVIQIRRFVSRQLRQARSVALANVQGKGQLAQLVVGTFFWTSTSGRWPQTHIPSCMRSSRPWQIKVFFECLSLRPIPIPAAFLDL